MLPSQEGQAAPTKGLDVAEFSDEEESHHHEDEDHEAGGQEHAGHEHAHEEAPARADAGQEQEAARPAQDAPLHLPGELQAVHASQAALEHALQGQRPANPEDLQWFSPASGLDLSRNIEIGKLIQDYTSNRSDFQGMRALRPPAYVPLINRVSQPGTGSEVKQSRQVPPVEVLLAVKQLFGEMGYTITDLDRDVARWWLGASTYLMRATEAVTDQPEDEWKVYASTLMLKGFPFAARYLSLSRFDAPELSWQDKLAVEMFSRTADNTNSEPPSHAPKEERAEWYRRNRQAQIALTRLQSAWLKQEGNMKALKENPSVQEYLYSAIYNDAWGMELAGRRVLKTLTPQQIGILTATVEGLRHALGYTPDSSIYRTQMEAASQVSSGESATQTPKGEKDAKDGAGS